MRLHFPGRSLRSECFSCSAPRARAPWPGKTLLHSPPKGLCSWPAPTAFGSRFLALSPLLDTSQACKPLLWPNGSREDLIQRSTSEQEAARSCRGTPRPCPARCSQAAPVSGQGEPGHIVPPAAVPAQPARGTGNIPAFSRSQQQHGNRACSPAGEMRSLPPGEGRLKLTGQVDMTAGLRIPNKSFLLGTGRGFPEKLDDFPSLQVFKAMLDGALSSLG